VFFLLQNPYKLATSSTYILHLLLHSKLQTSKHHYISSCLDRVHVNCISMEIYKTTVISCLLNVAYLFRQHWRLFELGTDSYLFIGEEIKWVNGSFPIRHTDNNQLNSNGYFFVFLCACTSVQSFSNSMKLSCLYLFLLLMHVSCAFLSY
jgi:hypothetical protein